ncbi:MAG: hypothetical protein IJU03_08360 [Thermoguttaceae bacterium]|nr:hypothetical protein [Thermoguttaceae bacterium]
MMNKLKKTLLDACFELSVASVIARQHNLPIKRKLSTAKEAVYEVLQLLQEVKDEKNYRHSSRPERV